MVAKLYRTIRSRLVMQDRWFFDCPKIIAHCSNWCNQWTYDFRMIRNWADCAILSMMLKGGAENSGPVHKCSLSISICDSFAVQLGYFRQLLRHDGTPQPHNYVASLSFIHSAWTNHYGKQMVLKNAEIHLSSLLTNVISKRLLDKLFCYR